MGFADLGKKKKTAERINLDDQWWDSSTFRGRLKYYVWVTDPNLSFISKDDVIDAKILLQKYRQLREPVGTEQYDVRRAQQIYHSAYHPDTGEMTPRIGRMCFQVPGGMLLIGAMVSFYRSTPAVLFWQFANQSFNAVVNYANRNAKSEITNTQMGVAFASATTSALVTSLALKSWLAKHARPSLQRFVPFCAVAAANMINVPLMRQNEILHGVKVFDKDGNHIGESRYAAVKGISQVVTSRILIMSPGMLLIPAITEYYERNALLWQRNKWISPVFQTVGSGFTLLLMVPIGCALFDQRCSIPTEKLSSFDRQSLSAIAENYGKPLPSNVYFNKGL